MRKKKVIIRVIAMVMVILMLFGVMVMFAGCAEAETATTSKRAIISLPNGEKIEGAVTDKYTWANGVVEVCIDGKTYTTYWNNVLIIEE